MSEDFLVQQPIATWNSVRGVWEKPGMVSLLCEHWELFSETWPTSGMMRGGQVYELPTRAHLITGSGFSLRPIPEQSMLRTPQADEGRGGAISEDEARARGNMVNVRDQMAQLAAENGLKVAPGITEGLLPTPNTMEHLPARTGEARERQLHRGGSESRRASSGNLREDILDVLLPTPVTTDHKQNDSPAAWDRHSPQMGTIVHSTEWGKFAPAIERWEQVLGRPAPAPTKPDGKDGAHRLSSAFTEWMMGLPDGWITSVGLTRNEELKACGNGVVPQQAELALRILLDGVSLERERERTVMLPTPTVSDTFTDNLGSTQQKPGSMHSVTLPQAVRQIGETEK
jgi:hypothetical protein